MLCLLLGNGLHNLLSMRVTPYRFLLQIVEFDRREAWGHAGVKSCAHWLNWKCGIIPGAAREKIRVAKAMPDLP